MKGYSPRAGPQRLKDPTGKVPVAENPISPRKWQVLTQADVFEEEGKEKQPGNKIEKLKNLLEPQLESVLWELGTALWLVGETVELTLNCTGRVGMAKIPTS